MPYEIKKAAEQKEEEEMKSLKSSELLLCGYISGIQRQYKLSYNIPDDIYCLVDMFYLKLLKWQLFCSKEFKLSNTGYDIEGRSSNSSNAYSNRLLIYPLCLSPNGYSKGIHYLTIQRFRNTSGTIGVVSGRDTQMCEDKEKAAAVDWKSSIVIPWGKKMCITIKLDCDAGTVEYYQDVRTQAMHRDKIEVSRSYYFALLTSPWHAWFRIVSTPSCIA